MRLRKAMGIAEAGFEQALLAHERADRRDVQVQADDGRSSLQGFEVCGESAEQDAGVGGGCRQAEAARVGWAVFELQCEGEFRGNDVRTVQFEGQSIEETTQEEE